MIVIGTNLPRVDGEELARGHGRFTADMLPKGALVAKILKSPHPHARIVHIDATRALRVPGVRSVLSHLDVPRIMYTTAGQHWPEPSPYDCALFDSKVRFIGDRVAAIAATDLDAAQEGLECIQVEYELLPAVFDAKTAMEPGAPIIHDEPDAVGILDASRNLCGRIIKRRGDLKTGFRKSAVILEQEYETHRVQHCSLEPHVVATWFDGQSRLNVVTSTQVPLHVRRHLGQVLQLPLNKIVVKRPRIGGGFGGKQDMLLEGVCGALSISTKSPVFIEYSRSEEFSVARCRHPQAIRLKIGAGAEGQLLALEMHCISNTGAYGSHGVTVAGNTGSKVLGLYSVPNLYFEALVAYTNTVVSGAFRGYGCPQGFFALETLLDELAEQLGVTPWEIRQRNAVQIGSRDRLTFMGELGHKGKLRVIRSTGFNECVQRATELTTPWRSHPTRATSKTLTGVGLGCSMQGSGVSGISSASATVSVNEDGSVLVVVPALDIGTGSDTIAAQIAAETLEIHPRKVFVKIADTDDVCFGMGAYASGTTFVLGNAVKIAADKCKRRIREAAARVAGVKLQNVNWSNDGRIVVDGTHMEVETVVKQLLYRHGHRAVGIGEYRAPDSPAPFCALIAEVEVDAEIASLRVTRLTCVVDVGRALNVSLLMGQIEGAIVQGLGYTLTEDLQLDDHGRVRVTTFNDYSIPTSMDIPEMCIEVIEGSEPLGPYGAKSAGEVAISAVAPAVANAFHDAVGIRLRKLPFTHSAIRKVLSAQA